MFRKIYNLKVSFLCLNKHLRRDFYFILSIFRTAPGKTSQLPVSPASTKSSLLYRNTASRNTFHGGPIRDRRQQRQINGPDGVPSRTQDESSMNTNRQSFFNKISQKFSRRYVITFLMIMPLEKSLFFIFTYLFIEESVKFRIFLLVR